MQISFNFEQSTPMYVKYTNWICRLCAMWESLESFMGNQTFVVLVFLFQFLNSRRLCHLYYLSTTSLPFYTWQVKKVTCIMRCMDFILSSCLDKYFKVQEKSKLSNMCVWELSILYEINGKTFNQLMIL